MFLLHPCNIDFFLTFLLSAKWGEIANFSAWSFAFFTSPSKCLLYPLRESVMPLSMLTACDKLVLLLCRSSDAVFVNDKTSARNVNIIKKSKVSILFLRDVASLIVSLFELIRMTSVRACRRSEKRSRTAINEFVRSDQRVGFRLLSVTSLSEVMFDSIFHRLMLWPKNTYTCCTTEKNSLTSVML